jgi:hypothetical protein
LQPGSGRGTQIDETFCVLEKRVLLVELDQLEGGTGTVALFFGEVVVFVETTFAVLAKRGWSVCEDCSERVDISIPSFGSPSFVSGRWSMVRVDRGEWMLRRLSSASSEKVAAGRV